MDSNSGCIVLFGNVSLLAFEEVKIRKWIKWLDMFILTDLFKR